MFTFHTQLSRVQCLVFQKNFNEEIWRCWDLLTGHCLERVDSAKKLNSWSNPVNTSKWQKGKKNYTYPTFKFFVSAKVSAAARCLRGLGFDSRCFRFVLPLLKLLLSSYFIENEKLVVFQRVETRLNKSYSNPSSFDLLIEKLCMFPFLTNKSILGHHKSCPAILSFASSDYLPQMMTIFDHLGPISCLRIFLRLISWQLFIQTLALHQIGLIVSGTEPRTPKLSICVTNQTVFSSLINVYFFPQNMSFC